MSNISPSILLCREAPDDPEFDSYLPLFGIAACVYFLICAEANFRRADRIAAITGPQAVTERIEGRIDAMSSNDMSKRHVTYKYPLDGAEISDWISCRTTSVCHTMRAGPVTILVNRAAKVSLPEPVLRRAPMIERRALHRGWTAMGTAILMLLSAGAAHLWLARRS